MLHLKFCLLIVAAISGAAKGWKLGNGLKYDLTTILLFRETGPAKPGGDVGFQLTGHLELTPVWKDRYDTDIVLLQFKVPTLNYPLLQRRLR